MSEISSTYKKSVLDRVSDAISPILRDISDVNIGFFGTLTQILRITRKVSTKKLNTLQNTSVLGDFESSLETDIYHNCDINYPFNDLEIFVSRMTSEGYQTAETNIHGIDVTDILPITMNILFEGKYYDDPIELKKDDIIVDIFWDSNNNPIPIIMQLMRLRGSFFGKNQITKKCELSLYRKDLSQELDEAITNYVEYVKDVRREELLNASKRC